MCIAEDQERIWCVLVGRRGKESRSRLKFQKIFESPNTQIWHPNPNLFLHRHLLFPFPPHTRPAPDKTTTIAMFSCLLRPVAATAARITGSVVRQSTPARWVLLDASRSCPLTNLRSRNLSILSSSNALSAFRAQAVAGPAPAPTAVGVPTSVSIFDALQKRWKSRGNTYQPSTLKRKRVNGFLARSKSRGGKKILARRKAKGRWYLTH